MAVSDLTLAILSWGYHETLLNTLQSYERFGLKNLATESVIFFQEINKKDREIAQDYGYVALGSPDNIGIAEAYQLLAAYASGEFFLFQENDFVCMENAKTRIEQGKILLNSGTDFVKLRHRKFPGNPLWTRQYEGREYDKPTHLLDSIHWTDPSKFPEISKVEIGNELWYTTTARNANYSNNPHLVKTAWLRENIIPRLGNRDIEIDIQEWWQNQGFIVSQGEGLFQHMRGN